MMLHDKMMPGQILLDMRNECSSNKMDIYNAYNFHHQQQQIQQHRLESQVLDLSRRCDSVETRKTPSPYNSSFGTASPSTNCGSPQNLSQTSSVPAVAAPLRQNPIPLPQGIASLYPLYYQNIKQENASPPPAPVMPNPLPFFQHNPSALLQQTFNKNQSSTTYPSPKSEGQQCRSPPSDAGSVLYPNILNAATTGTVTAGKTRPFNAYPRDPLLVAAHFAASDVLFDKTTMERYSTYRKRALDDLQSTNGGHRIVTNPKMRRTNHRNGPNSESEERAMESSDNDSSSGCTDSNKNDSNNNNDSGSCGGIKDEAYFERRRKNNAAAKKSRDRRRIKEDEIAIRAAYLERQNIELLCQVEALKKQLEAFTKA